MRSRTTIQTAQIKAQVLTGWRENALKGLKALSLAALFLLCMA